MVCSSLRLRDQGAGLEIRAGEGESKVPRAACSGDDGEGDADNQDDVGRRIDDDEDHDEGGEDDDNERQTIGAAPARLNMNARWHWFERDFRNKFETHVRATTATGATEWKK